MRHALIALALLAVGCTEAMEPAEVHEEITAAIGQPDPPKPFALAAATATMRRAERPATRDPGPGGAPALRRVQATYDATTLTLSAQYPPGFDYDAYLDPTRIGGWCFQLFLDTDQDPATGYGRGYEFLVNGAELVATAAPIRNTLRVRPAWGLRTGEARLARSKRGLEVRVPLSALAGDDGVSAWELHLYRMVAGYEAPEEPASEFVGTYEGVSTPR